MTLADLFNPQQWIGAFSPAVSKEGLQFASTLPLFGGIGTAGKMFGTTETALAAAKKIPQAAPAAAQGLSSFGKTALAVGGGIGIAGFGLSSLFGGGTSKKDVAQSGAIEQKMPVDVKPSIIETHAPYENYQPKIDIRTVYNNDNSISSISNSPNASISKKQSTDMSGSTPGSWNTPTSYSQPTTVSPSQGATLDQAATQADGTNIALIAAIAGIALLGHGYLTRRKSK